MIKFKQFCIKYIWMELEAGCVECWVYFSEYTIATLSSLKCIIFIWFALNLLQEYLLISDPQAGLSQWFLAKVTLRLQDS